MRERLIELINEMAKYIYEQLMDGNCEQSLYAVEHIDELKADYLLDNGVIVPPCKVGDKFWMIDCSNRIQKCKIFSVNYHKNQNDDMWMYGIKIEDGMVLTCEDDDIGKYVFLTREEAERALQGRKEDGKR